MSHICPVSQLVGWEEEGGLYDVMIQGSTTDCHHFISHKKAQSVKLHVEYQLSSCGTSGGCFILHLHHIQTHAVPRYQRFRSALQTCTTCFSIVPC